MTSYDIEYEMFRYIDEQAENYVTLKELLLQHGSSYDEALRKASEFKEKYYRLLEKHGIKHQNLVSLCYDLASQLKYSSDSQELLYLYFCTITDTGLLSEKQAGEQAIRNYFQQSEKVHELTVFSHKESECKKRLRKIMLNMKKTAPIGTADDLQEFQLLYELTLQHTFLYGAGKSKVYKDNLHSLLMNINGNEFLKPLKPYMVFAVLSRKHGMMQNREHYIPNLQTPFQYQEYQIYTDNGKNFNLYQSYLELYDHLRRTYESDETVDLTLCDHCFANFSPLSEWYYMYCQPDTQIPMNLKQTVKNDMAGSFPMLCCYEDYGDCDVAEFENAHSEVCNVWDMVIDDDMSESFLQVISQNQEIREIAVRLPYYEEYPRYAELFLYVSAERLLSEQMADIADIISN